ncbi:hypothetical protein MMF93_22865 [Streptomyces tubbatahanensis]|uniref:Uncharacterized protein n=1 Tax=Streptomyces tubbatahanensis TaxID=2923272 RepID=A0ABY3XWW0_9ACTN|nr:hypothetical protein [Streptomyces tubbatahanensis]UNS98981.1 hypothetical protein MMF93_22865 [Streptomyces tubbatahanensis]
MNGYTIKAAGDREAVIRGLRDLADFLAAHPDVLPPAYPSVGVLVGADDEEARRESPERAATPLGVPVEELGDGFLSADLHFGPLRYYVAAVPPEGRK